jgi:hypothetical protein
METELRLAANGTESSVTCVPGTTLFDVLRDDPGLAGPKFGCGMGLYGTRFGKAEVGAAEVAPGPVVGAIGNSVADAVGVRVRDVPRTRELVAT